MRESSVVLNTCQSLGVAYWEMPWQPPNPWQRPPGFCVRVQMQGAHTCTHMHTRSRITHTQMQRYAYEVTRAHAFSIMSEKYVSHTHTRTHTHTQTHTRHTHTHRHYDYAVITLDDFHYKGSQIRGLEEAGMGSTISFCLHRETFNTNKNDKRMDFKHRALLPLLTWGKAAWYGANAVWIKERRADVCVNSPGQMCSTSEECGG